MKSILILGFLFQMIAAFEIFQYNSTSFADNNIWVPFMSDAVLAQDAIKKCAINVHLKNNGSLNYIAILRFLNQKKFR